MYRKNQKQIAILLVLFVSMTTLTIISMNFQIISNNNNAGIENGDDIDDILQISAPHAPIHIDNNWSAAEASGICTGSGTEEDPYIIQDYEIDCGGIGNGISIYNTTDYFKIVNCTIFNTGPGAVPYYTAGIQLFNVTNGLITNSNVSVCERYNVHLRNAHNNTFSNNILHDTDNSNGWAGVYIEDSTYNMLSDNSLDNNRWYAFWLSNCNNTIFIGNDINVVTVGFFSAISSNNNTFEDNRIFGGAVNSMKFTNANDNLFKRNKLYDSTVNGLELVNSDFNTITCNIFSGHGNDGLKLTGGGLSNNNTIYKNYFTNNDGFNGNDEGTNNVWTHQWVGNYWDDHVGIDENNDGICDNNYTVNGTSSSRVDTMPIFGNPFHDGGPLFINGSAQNGNTSWYWMYQRAFSYGSNTKEDPLVIEDLVINGQKTNNCLEIIDTTTINVTIDNCTFYNSSETAFTGGVVLEDTANIVIQNCNVSNNANANGFFLDGNNNRTKIINCIIENNGLTGLNNYQSDWTELSGCVIDSTSSNGAYFYQSNNLTISDNIITSNYRGMFLYDCESANIYKNTATDNAIGIHLQHNCWNFTICNNTASNILSASQDDGIKLESNCDFISIYDNTLNDNTDNGIELTSGCDNNSIYNNSVDDTVTGIYLNLNCHNNSIYNNTVLNAWNAFRLFFSHNNTLITNIGDNNAFYGLEMQSSNGTFLRGNIFNGNVEGLSETTSFYTQEIINIYSGVCTPILIDDNGGTADHHTWSEVVSWIPWIDGSGTWIDPYTIEALTIDANNESSGISIIDFAGYSLVQGCTVYNASKLSDAGIYLSRTENCQILNNNFSNNYLHGIYFINGCVNNTIENNTVNDNDLHGIDIFRNKNVTIINNTVDNNAGSGIFMYETVNSTIENNTANNNQYNIFVDWESTNNTIIGNNVSGGFFGIYIDDQSQYNTITGNMAYSSNVGISLVDGCDRNNISGNMLINNFFLGLDIDGSDYNRIYDNIIGNTIGTEQDTGIEATNSFNLTIYGNTIFNHTDYELSMDNCDGSIIIGNELSGNIGDLWYFNNDYINFATNKFEGVYSSILIDDNGGTVNALTWDETISYVDWISGTGTWNDPYLIKDLVVDGNYSGNCILIKDSDLYSRIEGCTTDNTGTGGTGNYDAGIFLDNVNNCTVIGNDCSDDYFGIVTYPTCINVTIETNTVNDNSMYGIFTISLNHGYIYNNSVSSNSRGIYIYNTKNTTVENNTASGNTYNIRAFQMCYNNTIIGNTVDGGTYGLYIYNQFQYNNITNNTIINTNNAFWLGDDSSHNNISENTIWNNFNNGMDVDDSPYNIIYNNDIGNTVGAVQNKAIEATDSSNLTIYANTFFLHTNYGIDLDNCDGSLIVGNDFYGNTIVGDNIRDVNNDYVNFAHNKFDEIYTPILIDNTGGTDLALTWAEMNFYVPWIGSDGSWGDPYIIEDLVIDGMDQASCIDIIDSTAYVIIRNCTLYNSIGNGANREGGIRIDNSQNIEIRNNNCSNNQGQGIVLDNNCENCTLINNFANNNDWSGIEVMQTGNQILIYNNSANKNGYVGINIYGGTFINVSDNIANDNAQSGILLVTTSNCTVTRNTLCNDELINQQFNGIHLWGLTSNSFNNITYNTIYDNSLAGIKVNSAYNNIIAYNTIERRTGTYQDYGIWVQQGSANNTIYGNQISDQGLYGICLDNVDYNVIDNNTIWNTLVQYIDYGIYLKSGSINNSIYGNQVSNVDDYGIVVSDSSHNNSVIENVVSDSILSYIYVTSSCRDAIVTKNTVWSSGVSAILGNTDENEIYDNFIRDSTGWYINPFVIDNDGSGSYTWAEASQYWWCNGSGSWSDPYLVDDATIDADFSGSCIIIRDSTVYYRISNCLLSNSGINPEDAGIFVENTDNGQIINNDCSINCHYGIYLKNSDNHTISGNVVNYNDVHGIYLYICDDNTITGNFAYYNDGSGIVLELSDDNEVTDNSLNNNQGSGIILKQSNMNEVTGNTANYNSINGINIENSDNNNVSENFANGNDNNGIILLLSDTNNVTRNEANSNSENGILLDTSNSNTVNENTVQNNAEDIKSVNCVGNYISNNILTTVPPPPEDEGDTIINEGDTITPADSAMGIAIAAIIIAAAIGAISILLLLKMSKENQDLRNMVMTTNKSIKELKLSQPAKKGPVKKAPAKRTPVKKK